MDFQQLLAKMVELDQPATEAINTQVTECPPDMTPPMNSPMDNKPAVPEPSMSLNLNAQGMDNIESLMKLMTKVNPDMINQPQGGMPPMPSLTPPGPSISSIGDLGNLDAGPLKMLPDLDSDNDNMPGGEKDMMPEPDEKDGEEDGEKDNDKEKEGAMGAAAGGALGALATKSPAGAMAGADIGSDIEDKLSGDESEKEAFVNSLDDSEPEEMDMDAVIRNGDDLHKQKSMHKAAAGGDNPMRAEGTDLRAQIRAELQQRLAEAKGAK